ncbi:hypothetical protein PHYBLDRAFT_138841 [Phycomyces blakesleeanus NRRL 1555(-)]|uniref:Uncharacterized protein n=1 Tax=Phycomyces blakesleeanus (strain ATCC 8743b / DSM 1359 / FGSC 10004 / NBRC 33097 / NRRL 1555) TaxID=763407 RepID=A0A167RBK5_PHYB8|nr:hypothetical protein PHYBLDRAFT_138841 [Phycomyces blakesleeanus NRRL 1555(-)]OAD81294.1 hypothetical protein PHYBLDRAFT_138841 [Phycomyces blakesleeanus NRRL 1555(-)]|eukprot:XP_018299334.1 hypothetical protein PHYBLDRAFT_138841 [Phycomyces blakesleeanus NRRL 1555(-)]
MIEQDLGISLTAEVKEAINTCIKHICDQLAALSSVQILGPNPSWTSIPQEDRTRMCVSHSHALKNYEINFIRCHKNWTSITKRFHCDSRELPAQSQAKSPAESPPESPLFSRSE